MKTIVRQLWHKSHKIGKEISLIVCHCQMIEWLPKQSITVIQLSNPIETENNCPVIKCCYCECKPMMGKHAFCLLNGFYTTHLTNQTMLYGSDFSGSFNSFACYTKILLPVSTWCPPNPIRDSWNVNLRLELWPICKTTS